MFLSIAYDDDDKLIFEDFCCSILDVFGTGLRFCDKGALSKWKLKITIYSAVISLSRIYLWKLSPHNEIRRNIFSYGHLIENHIVLRKN